MVNNHTDFNYTNSAMFSYDSAKTELQGLSLDKAIQAVEEFIKKSPDVAEAHNDLGVFYYQAGNKLQTLGHYEKAVKLDPLNSTFRKNLASFYFVEMGWTDDAIEIYVDILKSFPTDCEVLTALAIISSEVGRPSEAKIFLDRIVALEPWNNEARQAAANLNAPQTPTLESLNNEHPDMQVPTSVSEIDAILAGLRAPSSQAGEKSDDLYRRALKLAEDGRIEDAVKALEALLLKSPSDPLAHNDLGVLYSRIEDNDKALFHHGQAVALAPTNITFRKNFAGILYSAANMADEAISMYSSLLKESPHDVDVLGALAIISIDNNRTDEALIFLNRILELEPTNPVARQLVEQLRRGGSKDFFLAAG